MNGSFSTDYISVSPIYYYLDSTIGTQKTSTMSSHKHTKYKIDYNWR